MSIAYFWKKKLLEIYFCKHLNNTNYQLYTLYINIIRISFEHIIRSNHKPPKHIRNLATCTANLAHTKQPRYQDGRHSGIETHVLTGCRSGVRRKMPENRREGGCHRSFIQSASYRRLADPISTHHIQLRLFHFGKRATSC